MTAIQEGKTAVTRAITRDQARVGERVTVMLVPGQWHPTERTDRIGGRVINWGPRGLSIRRTLTGNVVYIVNDTIETVISQER